MNQPWYFVGLGALFLAFGGFVTFVGLTNDNAGALIPAGWLVSGIAGMATFVGLVGLGVEIGTRAARR